MKHLQILNLSLAAMAAAFAVVLAVVCVLYAANYDAAPKLARELPRLFVMTGLFAAFAGAAALAWWARSNRKTWAWWPQAALVPAAAAVFFGIASAIGLR